MRLSDYNWIADENAFDLEGESVSDEICKFRPEDPEVELKDIFINDPKLRDEDNAYDNYLHVHFMRDDKGSVTVTHVSYENDVYYAEQDVFIESKDRAYFAEKIAALLPSSNIREFVNGNAALEYASSLHRDDAVIAIVNGHKTLLTSTSLPIERRFREPIEDAVRGFLAEMAYDGDIDDITNLIGAEVSAMLWSKIEANTPLRILSANNNF